MSCKRTPLQLLQQALYLGVTCLGMCLFDVGFNCFDMELFRMCTAHMHWRCFSWRD